MPLVSKLTSTIFHFFRTELVTERELLNIGKDVGNKIANKFRKQGYPINEELLRYADNYRLPKLDDFTSVPTGPTYEEKRSNFLALVKTLRSGLTEIIFHPSAETDNLRTITGSWQQRVWEADLFADPVVHQFFKQEGIIITTWKEIMKRFEDNK